MMRCLVAIAHADGVFHDDERAYIETMMRKNTLSADQIETLRNDMDTPQRDIGALFAEIDDPAFRGQVVYFARLMAHKDGVLSPSEEDLVTRLNNYALGKIDLDAIKEDVHRAVQAEMLAHEIVIDEGRPTKKGAEYTFFRWLDEGLQNIGIDLMQD